MTAPICPYCKRTSEMVTGAEVYPHRPDLAAKKLWRCPNAPCDAYVGCHPGTTVPLGRLANLELRQAKLLAHAHFDRRWKSRMGNGKKTAPRARSEQYSWLARQMGLVPSECHIGKFDVHQCREVVRHCELAEHRGMVS